MFSYTKTAALLAIAACAPIVCQAQDLVGSVAQAEKLNAARKYAEAEKLCDTIIKKFNAKSKVTQQFEYLMPFYLWQKGIAQVQLKKYDAAVATFGLLADEKWQDKAMRERAKNAQRANMRDPKQAVGYDPLLTMSVFQKGYARFKQAAGDEDTKGDVSKFDEAITYLEEYLDLLEANKVSKAEREKRLNGQVCFLLLQSYLLKEKPDFSKGKEYLERSRKGKGRLPEDMVMRGLNTIIGVALQDGKETNADVLDLAHSALASLPMMETTTAAVNASRFISYGGRAASYAQKALRAGDLRGAEAAARIMSTLYSFVPPSSEVMDQFGLQLQWMGTEENVSNALDRETGKVYNVRYITRIRSDYAKLIEGNTDPEAYAIISAANVHLALGSNRLGKAGYQVLLDRYPNLVSKDKDGKEEKLGDKIKYQLAQLHYVTGDEAAGEKLEATLSDAGSLGDSQVKNLAFNKMRRLLKEQNWEALIPAAQEVVKLNANDPKGAAAVTAEFIITSAYFKLNKPEEVIKSGEALLNSGNLVPGTGKGALKKDAVENYEKQLFYFVMDAYYKLGAVDTGNYTKALEIFAKYCEKYPSTDVAENALVAHSYYLASDCLLKLSTTRGDEEQTKADIEKALEYCRTIGKNWPESPVYANAQLVRGSILCTDGKRSEAEKSEGIAALEEAYKASLKKKGADGKLSQDGRLMAANALYLLYSLAPEIPREGEDEAARMARTKGYADTFWQEVDSAGNVYALNMAGTQVRRATDKVKPDDPGARETCDAALAKFREVILREAAYAFRNNKKDESLEEAVNSYVDAYKNAYDKGFRKLEGDKSSEDEVIAHLEAFGVEAGDKYFSAILRNARITELTNKLTKNKPESGENGEQSKAAASRYAEMREEIAQEVRTMGREFKPEELTSSICLRIADNFRDFGESIIDADREQGASYLNDANSFYDAVISRNTADSVKGKARKADALRILGKIDDAVALLQEVINSGTMSDPEVYFTLANCYKAKGDTAKTIEAGNNYLSKNGRRRTEISMLMADAYAQSNSEEDINNAIKTYDNLLQSQTGTVSVSAPACKRLMEQLWRRNRPSSGDIMGKDYIAPDRWLAWKTGEDYVKLLEGSGFKEKMTVAETRMFDEVVSLVREYGQDSTVQGEESKLRDLRARTRN